LRFESKLQRTAYVGDRDGEAERGMHNLIVTMMREIELKIGESNR
jgi:hypothetical protein